MRILITNDDGIRAEGLRYLVDVAKHFGDVKVVAPDRERSACAHAMTMRDPLRVKQFEWDGVEALEVNGFPVDCVNVGLTVLYPEGCDLVLSGINNGPNMGFDVTYSGTVAGAMEGTINGIRSIAISMAGFAYGSPLHYNTGAKWLREHFLTLAELPQAPLTFLNINVPAVEYIELRGHRVVPMGQRVYQDRVESRTDPWGQTYYWQGGVAAMGSNQPGTDVGVVSEGFVSISPITLDWTNHNHLEVLSARMSKAHA
jgi:5'-nucleotidase